jgi:site-specific DNA recombinase
LRFRPKLRKIQAERQTAEAGLASAGLELAIGVGVLVEALGLVSNPEQLYAEGNDAIRAIRTGMTSG